MTYKLHDSLLRAKKELKLANNKINSLNNQIKLTKKENSDLNVLVEKLLVENNVCS